MIQSSRRRRADDTSGISSRFTVTPFLFFAARGSSANFGGFRPQTLAAFCRESSRLSAANIGGFLPQSLAALCCESWRLCRELRDVLPRSLASLQLFFYLSLTLAPALAQKVTGYSGTFDQSCGCAHAPISCELTRKAKPLPNFCPSGQKVGGFLSRELVAFSHETWRLFAASVGGSAANFATFCRGVWRHSDATLKFSFAVLSVLLSSHILS